MIVYGDLLFLINFSMDFLCFYLSCLLLHRRLYPLRACAASILGGIYSVAALFLSVDTVIGAIIDIVVLIIMCIVAYGLKKTDVGTFIKTFFLYFFVSALLGGMMTALFSLFNSWNFLESLSPESDGVDAWAFALLALIGSILAFGGGRIFRSSFSKKEVILQLYGNGSYEKFRTLVDSGNLASEPISGKGVVFVNIEKCKKIIDKELYAAIKNNSIIDDIEMSALHKIRLVPTCSLSGKCFFPALKFKRALIINGKRKKDIDVYVSPIDAGILGNYDAIISHEAII